MSNSWNIFSGNKFQRQMLYFFIFLRFTGNRFTEDDAVIIGKALSKNSTLEELNLGNNPLKAQGVSDLIHAITPQVSPNSALRLLDLENVWANKDVLHNLEVIKMLRPWITVKLGGILSNYQLIGPNIRRILLKRANYEAMLPKRKRQRRNFGRFVMSLRDEKISRGMFARIYIRFFLMQEMIVCIFKKLKTNFLFFCRKI